MPRAGLSAALIAGEAAAMSDESGSDDVTLAALARRFGVAVPSLYKHVGSLDDVRRLVQLAALRELDAALRAALEEASLVREAVHGNSADAQPGSDPLPVLADAYRRFARNHPGRYRYLQRAPEEGDHEMEDAASRLVGSFLDVLARYGVTGEAAIHTTRIVRSALHGFVDLERQGGFGLPTDVDASFAALVEVLRPRAASAT